MMHVCNVPPAVKYIQYFPLPWPSSMEFYHPVLRVIYIVTKEKERRMRIESVMKITIFKW